MKNFIKGIPFALLLVLVPFFFYSEPNLAQSIIIASISALCGYRYYLMEKEQPNYALLFSKDIITLKKEISEIKDKHGELALGRGINYKAQERDFKW